MCNVSFLLLCFISCFSCIICVLLCPLCVGKDYQIHSNASVVFCGGISAGRYSTKNSTWHEWSPAPDTGTSTNHVAAGFTPAASGARPPDRGRGSGSMASPEKIARGHKKASLTKAIGALRRSIAEKDTGKVNSNLTKIKTVFSVFAEANEVYVPKVTLEPFRGDPLRYNEFMALFDEMVDMKKVEDHVKLSKLLQFTCNDAKNAIRHCSLAGSNGYQQARKILAARFGDEYVISLIILNTENP